MTFPIVQQPLLPISTIVPENENLYIPYFNRLYEDVAGAVNASDKIYFTTAIGSSAVNIPNLANFGAFIICVSGTLTTFPTLTASLCKADATASGSIAVLGHQAGTSAWAGFVLTITSTATNFQIAHNNTGIMGNFNIRIIGTQ